VRLGVGVLVRQVLGECPNGGEERLEFLEVLATLGFRVTEPGAKDGFVQAGDVGRPSSVDGVLVWTSAPGDQSRFVPLKQVRASSPASWGYTSARNSTIRPDSGRMKVSLGGFEGSASLGASYQMAGTCVTFTSEAGSRSFSSRIGSRSPWWPG
jgi:hypothetical protein